MELLIPAAVVILLSVLLGMIALLAFINSGVFPVPREDEAARWLYWRAGNVRARVGIATVVIVLLSLSLGAITFYWAVGLLWRSDEWAVLGVLMAAGIAQALLTYHFVVMRRPTRERGCFRLEQRAEGIRRLLLADGDEPRRVARRRIFDLALYDPAQAGTLVVSLLRDRRSRDVALTVIREIESNLTLQGFVNPFRLHLDGEIRRLERLDQATDTLMVDRHLLQSKDALDGWERVRRTKGVQWAVKRSLDILLSAMTLVVVGAIPMIIVVAVCLRVGSGSRLIFASRRLGYRGRQFTYYQFDVASLRTLARYPRLKEFLLQTGLYRIPALVNVIRGEMSLVGPSPLYYTTLGYLGQRPAIGMEKVVERLGMPPGLAGLAQLAHYQAPGKNDCDDYVLLDLEYIRNWSLAQDLRILASTVTVLFVRLFPRGVRATLTGPRTASDVLASLRYEGSILGR